MEDFDPHINIEPLVEARDTNNYIIKEIDLENSIGKIETPFKIMDVKNVSESVANSLVKNRENAIFESWNFVNKLNSYNKLYEIIEEPEGNQIQLLDKFFSLKKRLWNNSSTTLSLVFQKNPFEANKFNKGVSKPLSSEGYEFLLDYIHSASSAFVLVPDIKMDDNFKMDDYIKYVDESVQILSDFNSKPIFVPIPIQLNNTEFEKLIKYYRYKGYTNIWVNFNASQMSGTYFTRVRYLLRTLKKEIQLTRTALYFSHIRKEIDRNVRDEKTVASNALAPFFGSDFLGISREPQSNFNSKSKENYMIKNQFNTPSEMKEAQLLNRTRVFDPDTYYYYNVDISPSRSVFDEKILKADTNNRMINSLLLDYEMNRTRNFVESNKVLKPYLKEKTALNDILEKIIAGNKKQSKLLEFMGKL
jgi:hypothetical protein